MENNTHTTTALAIFFVATAVVLIGSALILGINAAQPAAAYPTNLGDCKQHFQGMGDTKKEAQETCKSLPLGLNQGQCIQNSREGTTTLTEEECKETFPIRD